MTLGISQQLLQSVEMMVVDDSGDIRRHLVVIPVPFVEDAFRARDKFIFNLARAEDEVGGDATLSIVYHFVPENSLSCNFNVGGFVKIQGTLEK